MAQTIETIRRLVVHAEERGMADLARKWRDVATAESEFIRISEQSSKEGANAASSMANAYSRVLNKIEPLRPEVTRLAADMQKLTAAHEQFGTSTTKRKQEIEGLISSTRSYREETKKVAQAEAEIARVRAVAQAEISGARAVHVADVSQRNINQLTGVRDPTSSARQSAAVFEEQFRRIDEIEAARAAHMVETSQRAINQLTGVRDAAQGAAKASASIFEELIRAEDAAEQLRSQYQAIKTETNAIANQDAINRQLGVRDIKPGAARESAGVFEESIREQEMLAAKARELRAAIDPVAHSLVILKQEQADYNRMAELGYLSTVKNAKGFSQLDIALAGAEKKFKTIERNFGGDKLANSLRLTSSEMTNLGFQLNDIASGLAMGQSPFTILTQQGGQVYQILAGQGGLVNGLKAAGQWIGSLITPASVLGTILVAVATEALLAWNRFAGSQIEVTRALTGVGRQSGLTRDRINEIALASAGAAEVSVASAREIATELARTGKIGAASFDAIIRSAKDYAATTGQELPAASKELADIFASPSKGADILIEKLGAMDAATRDHIGALERSGHRTEAQAILNEALARSVAKASTVTSAWAIAWDKVARAVSNADEALGRALAGDSTAERISKRQRELEQMRDTRARLTEGQPFNRQAQRMAPRQAFLEREQADDTQLFFGEEESRASDMLRQQSRDSSLRARSATRAAFPEIEQLEKLKEASKDLLKALESPGAVSNLEATRTALEGVKGQIAEIAKFGPSPVDMRIGRMNEDYALQVLALQALTDEQRSAVAADQAYAASMRVTGNAVVAVTAAEAARGVILEQSRLAGEARIRAGQMSIANAQAEITALQMHGPLQTAFISRQRAEIEAIQKAGPLRAEYVARQQEINRLISEGADLTTDLSHALVDMAGAQAKVNKELASKTQSKDMLQQQRDQLELIEAEIRAIGMSDEARLVHIARIQAEIDIRRMLDQGLKVNAQEYIRNAEAMARASARLAEAQAAAAAPSRRTGWDIGADGSQIDTGGSGESESARRNASLARRDSRGWLVNSIAEDVTESLKSTMPTITLPRAPEGTRRLVNNSPYGGSPVSQFAETWEHLENRLKAARDAAEEIKQNVEDAAKTRFDRDASMYGGLLQRQISDLQERRGRIADNDNSGSRGTPYLDPYSFKNPTRFYNPGPGGHFNENESRTERAIGAASNAQIAAIDAQIATLEAQATQLDRLAMLSSAGVDLSAQELAELQSINAGIRAGASAQAGSDFDRMMEASNRRMAEELRAMVESINASIPQRPLEANAGPMSSSTSGPMTSSAALSAAGLSAYDTTGVGGASGTRITRGYAKGGEWTVPGASTGVDKPFIMGLAGGENVNITPANSNIGRKGRNLVQNVTINSMGSPDKVRRSTGEALREARRMGRKVAGGR